ncbi:hypothetical protein P6F34_gp21 [Pseudomonas phage MiCath]|uniref:Uncharacterized protein n=1 Tax=Pseudomonas phage MiCath TaxID=3003729 RepID=A0A9Y1HTD7_9CAUD|nr:hypothetical protein P6F34_gp21 [Pseudomonas phage MiCath]WAX22374.1 hypothetical protein [Pseudomonas phage MiCath]
MIQKALLAALIFFWLPLSIVVAHFFY